MIQYLRHITFFLVLMVAPATTAAGDIPKRVVSLNVCTDQLAILLARPGQLHSVSFLATDPKSSLLFAEAQAFTPNRGQAEEIFLMKPDLVLAGTYTTRSTVSMLQRLGFRVEEFSPESSIEEVKANIERMGNLLGNPETARKILEDIDRRITELRLTKGARPTAAFYYSNSYTSGAGTIVDDIASHAGLQNIAVTLGLHGTAHLALEQLLLAKPKIVIANEVHENAPALAQQNFTHPAFQWLLSQARTASIDGRVTACAGPHTIDAIEQLNHLALQLQVNDKP